MLNNVNVMGRLTKEPEIKTTPSGVSVCNFSIACNRPKRNGEDQPTDYIDIVAWRGTADFIGKWFHKGDPIIVSGRIQTRSYEDKEGVKRKVFEIVASEINFAATNKTNSQPKDEPPHIDEYGFENITDDELLF